MTACVRLRLVTLLAAFAYSLAAPAADSPIIADQLRGTVDYGHLGRSLALANMDGDADEELLVGEPGFGSMLGRIRVYSNAAFLVHLGDFFSRGTAPRSGDRFGEAIAVGDFDDDHEVDVAIGLPGRSYLDSGTNEFRAEAGVTEVHYGDGDMHLLCRSCALDTGLSGVVRSGDQQGNVLAVGDFNGDDYDDLAIGAPFAGEATSLKDYGMVNVVEGSATGLKFAPVPQQFQMYQGFAGLPDTAESHDQFGAALVAADFNRDGFDDLAIGVPGEDGHGAVLVVFGSPNGLIFANHLYFDSELLGYPPMAGDRFGAALASGDVYADGYADLLIGTPNADWTGPDVGAVSLLFGGDYGFNFEAVRLLSNPAAQSGSGFGASIAAGDLDRDGIDDVVVGSPALDDSGHTDAGGIHFFYGVPYSTFMRTGSTLHPHLAATQNPHQARHGSALRIGRTRSGNGAVFVGAEGAFMRGALTRADQPRITLLSDGFE